jgi:hypothetical protein
LARDPIANWRGGISTRGPPGGRPVLLSRRGPLARANGKTAFRGPPARLLVVRCLVRLKIKISLIPHLLLLTTAFLTNFPISTSFPNSPNAVYAAAPCPWQQLQLHVWRVGHDQPIPSISGLLFPIRLVARGFKLSNGALAPIDCLVQLDQSL